MTVTIQPVSLWEINDWLNEMIRDPNNSEIMQLITNFGGDRGLAVRDMGGFMALEGERVVGVISCSPTGEIGRPSIVGLWAMRGDVQVAAQLVRRAVDELINVHGAERVVVDSLFPLDHKTFREEVLGKEYWERLEVRRFGLPSWPTPTNDE